VSALPCRHGMEADHYCADCFVEQLTAERDQLRAEVERLKFMERMAIKADAEAAAFLRALRRYGHHRNGCSKFPAIDDSNPCDCGLDEVLR
jgi:hypothetical protein